MYFLWYDFNFLIFRFILEFYQNNFPILRVFGHDYLTVVDQLSDPYLIYFILMIFNLYR